jgi:hypothetical protein
MTYVLIALLVVVAGGYLLYRKAPHGPTSQTAKGVGLGLIVCLIAAFFIPIVVF